MKLYPTGSQTWLRCGHINFVMRTKSVSVSGNDAVVEIDRYDVYPRKISSYATAGIVKRTSNTSIRYR